jgi:hypothetical protein
MTGTTLFTWGYYGWGDPTPQLVEAVDAVETSRFVEPPTLGASADLLKNVHGVAEVAELDGDEIGYLLGKVA